MGPHDFPGPSKLEDLRIPHGNTQAVSYGLGSY